MTIPLSTIAPAHTAPAQVHAKTSASAMDDFQSLAFLYADSESECASQTPTLASIEETEILADYEVRNNSGGVNFFCVIS